MAERVLVSKRGDLPKGRPLTDTESRLAQLAVAVGLGLAAIGLADLTLLWIRPQFGSPEWEFGTISATLEGLTLPTIGLSLIAAGLITFGSRRAAFVVAILCMIAALLVVLAGALFSLTVPVAWKGTPMALKRAMKIAVAKDAALVVIYFALFVVLSWTAFAEGRRNRHA